MKVNRVIDNGVLRVSCFMIVHDTGSEMLRTKAAFGSDNRNELTGIIFRLVTRKSLPLLSQEHNQGSYR